MWYKPGAVTSLPDGRQDNTHYNVYGAYTVAGLLADAVAKEIPQLSKYIQHCDASVAQDGTGLYFTVQDAVADMLDSDKNPITILIGKGKWKRPEISKNVEIHFIMREGAQWID